MIQTKEKNIEGATYMVTQLPARRALKLKARLIKLFGPVFAQMYLTTSAEKSEDQQKQDMVRAVQILASTIDENVFENLVLEIVNGVRKNGVELTPSVVDIEFAGDIGTLYQVVWFVLEVNFSNFFSMFGIGNQSEQAPIPKEDTRKTFTKTYAQNSQSGV